MQPFGIPRATSSTGLAAPSRRGGGEELQEPAGVCDRSLPGRRGAQGHDRQNAGEGASSSVSAAVAAARSASAEAVEQAKGSAALRMACRSPCVFGFSPEFTTPGSPSASELLSKSLHAFDLGFTPSPIARSAASGLRDAGDPGLCAAGASSEAGPRLAAFEDVVPVAPMLAGTQAASAPLVIAPALAGPGAQHTAASSSLASRATSAKTPRRSGRRRSSEKTSAQALASHGVERLAISYDELVSAERRACSSRPSSRSARVRSEWPESAGAYERLDCMEAELLGPLGGPCGRGTGSAGLMRFTLPNTPLQGQPLPTAAAATLSTGSAAGSTVRLPQRRSSRRGHRGSHSSKGSRRSLRNDDVVQAVLADNGLADTMPEVSWEELRKEVALRDLEIEKLQLQLTAVEGDKERESKNGRLLRKQLELMLRQAPADDSACVPAQRDKHAHRKKGLENELQEVRKQLFSVKEDVECAARREVEAERARCEALNEQLASLQRERSEALRLLRALLAGTADADSREASANTQLEESSELIQELVKARDFHNSEVERLLSERTAEDDNVRIDRESHQRRHEKELTEPSLQRKFVDEQGDAASLQAELKVLTAKLDDMSKQHATLDEQKRRAQEELSSSGDALQRLRWECDHLKADREELDVVRAKLSTERSERCAEKQSQRQRLDEDSQRWKREEETLMSERDAATKASLDAQSNLEALQKNFTSLKADHEQALSNETHLKIKLRQQEEKEQRIRADFANECRELQASKQGLQEELARERRAKEDLQVREQPLRDKAESERRAKEDLAWRLQEVEQEAEAAEQEAEAAVQELEAACLERAMKVEEVQGELEKCRNERNERVLALQLELENAKRAAKVLRAQYDRQQYSLEEMERERDQLRDDSRERLKRAKMMELSKALDDEREVSMQLRKANRELQHDNLVLRNQLSEQHHVPSAVPPSPRTYKLPELQIEETSQVMRPPMPRSSARLSAAGFPVVPEPAGEVQVSEDEDEEEEEEEEEVEAEDAPVSHSSVRWIVDTPTTLDNNTPSPWDSSPSPKSKTQVSHRGPPAFSFERQSGIAEEDPSPEPQRSTDPFLLHRSSLVDEGVSIEGLLDEVEAESH